MRVSMTERPMLYLAPSLFLLLGVTAYPVVSVLILSLERRLPVFGISEFVGLSNYAFLLEDERFWNALGNTAYFSLVSVTLELGLGLAIAVLLNRTFRGRGVMRAVILVPWAIPTVVSARMWEWIYNPDFGLLNYLLGARINWLGDPFWALHAAILMDVWKTTPFAALLLMAGLGVIPVDIYRAAKADGASGFSVFRRITLPLLLPFVLIVLLFRILDAFRVFDAIYVLTGGGPANTTETLSVYAYKVLFQTLEFGYGSTLAVTVFLCVSVITLLLARFVRR